MHVKLKTRNTLFLALGLVITLLSSCLKIEPINTEKWQPDLAIPLINAELGIEDFLRSSIANDSIQIDNNDLITLIYKKELFSSKVEDYVSLNDFGLTVLDTVIGLPKEYFPFAFDIHQFDIKEGQMYYEITSPFLGKVDIDVNFFNIKSGNNHFTHTLSITSNGTTPTVASGVLDISGYTLDFSGYFIIQYDARNHAGERVTLQSLNYDFQNLKYSYAEGNFETAVISLEQDSIFPELITNSLEGQFNFDAPRLIFDIENSIGVPIQIKSNLLQGISRNGEVIPLTSFLSDGAMINYPSLVEVGSTTNTRISIDPNNSNIAQLIRAEPSRIDFQLEGLVFPPNTTENGFLIDTSSIKVDMIFELPLRLAANNLYYETVAEIDPNKINVADVMEVKFEIENGLPLAAEINLYFEDASGMVLDSLTSATEGIIIPSAILNDDKVVIDATQFSESYFMDELQVRNLYNSTHLRTVARIRTAPDGIRGVSFFNNEKYKFNIRVGLKTYND